MDIHADEATIKYAYGPSFSVDRPNQLRFLSILYNFLWFEYMFYQYQNIFLKIGVKKVNRVLLFGGLEVIIFDEIE